MTDASLIDELACARLMLRIGYCADRHDIEGFVALFAEDGETARPGGGGAVGHAAIRASMQARSRERITRHLLTPPAIVMTGADTAEGLCYFTMFDAMETDRDAKGEVPLRAPVVIGEYQQRYRRVDGEWRITWHNIVPVLRPERTATT